MNLCESTKTEEKNDKAELYKKNSSLLSLAKQGNNEAAEKLMSENLGLVRAIAKRFMGRGIEFEDLMQIGCIGMLRAIRSFDIERGCVFSTYAVPLIMGEIRRFLRDDGLIKINREQKRLGAILLKKRELFISEHGYEPQISELSSEAGVSVEEAALAIEATAPITYLSDPIFNKESSTVENTLSVDGECERTFEKIALSDAISKLPPLWRQIIVCRYFRDMSQQKTAELLSLSQVKVSREEKKIIAHLRNELK